MDKVYVAHPYAGIDTNKDQVELIILTLMQRHPLTLFISPIHTLGFAYNIMDYQQGMEYCYNLLSLCDVLLLCPGWEKSEGCRLEREYALKHDIPIQILNMELEP